MDKDADARQGSGPAQEADGRLPLPRQTTPTWEVELLLSAGLVFALFQVPGSLHRWAALASARMGDAGDMLAQMLLTYALLAVYTLIATFLVHLAARAYWVALVGIDSVYPQGIRWDKYTGGPVSRREMQRQIPSFKALIERADNMASLCFAFGLVVVISSLMGAALALPTVGVAILLSETVLAGIPLENLMLVLLAIVLAPIVAVGLVDKWMGRKDPEGRNSPRWLAALLVRYSRTPMNRLPSPLVLMLATNQRGKRAYILFALAFVLLMSVTFVDSVSRRSNLGHVGYAYAPSDDSVGAWPQHYRDRRDDPLVSWSAPSIQSMEVQGDWLQLLVPWDAERHEPLLARACDAPAGTLADDLDRDAGDPARRAAEMQVLACMARQLDLRLDGAAVSDVELAFSEDTGTGLPALLAMVPVRQLAHGRHELALRRFPSARTLRDPEELQEFEAAGPLRIPFWR